MEIWRLGGNQRKHWSHFALWHSSYWLIKVCCICADHHLKLWWYNQNKDILLVTSLGEYWGIDLKCSTKATCTTNTRKYKSETFSRWVSLHPASFLAIIMIPSFLYCEFPAMMLCFAIDHKWWSKWSWTKTSASWKLNNLLFINFLFCICSVAAIER